MKNIPLVSILSFGFLLVSSAGNAQTVNLNPSASKAPVELEADEGVEWNRSAKTIKTFGRSRAKQGTMQMMADEIAAQYRETSPPKSRNEVFRLTATGNLVISSDKETITGDSAEYDIDQAVIILKGNDVKLVSSGNEVQAKTMEYWQEKNMAVARDKAVATRDGNKVAADVMTAFFKTESGSGGKKSKTLTKKSQVIERIEAFGNVKIITKEGTVTGEKGFYNLDREIATLTGDVKITQGRNYLVGDMAEVNMKTGISRLKSLPADSSGREGKDRRVRGIFIPEKAKPLPRAPSPTSVPQAEIPDVQAEPVSEAPVKPSAHVPAPNSAEQHLSARPLERMNSQEPPKEEPVQP